MILNADKIILVNENDESLGTMDKMEAHTQGILHRAFSIFILNDKNELLIQQRVNSKYHSGGLWSNTCCSHPKPLEDTLVAAHRRLQEEMGFDCELKPLFTFRYKCEVSNELIENEFDHIFLGHYNGPIKINPNEVSNYKFIAKETILDAMQKNPEEFTPWLHIVFPRFIEHLDAKEPIVK
ncbi:MAG TPA: isopentenyl-diphosphate Delta-isomerase [Flavipsychrobacter sp.]|nr:isopentenyl-diphosphate Delta-isomerase [Flavipsychrobacter sp.]